MKRNIQAYGGRKVGQLWQPKTIRPDSSVILGEPFTSLPRLKAYAAQVIIVVAFVGLAASSQERILEMAEWAREPVSYAKGISILSFFVAVVGGAFRFYFGVRLSELARSVQCENGKYFVVYEKKLYFVPEGWIFNAWPRFSSFVVVFLLSVVAAFFGSILIAEGPNTTWSPFALFVGILFARWLLSKAVVWIFLFFVLISTPLSDWG